MYRSLMSLVLLLGIALPALAQVTPSNQDQDQPDLQRGPGRRGPDGDGQLRRSLSQLNLSPQQKQQVEQIMGRDQALFDQYRGLRQQMRQAEGQGDTATVQKLQQQMQTLRPQLKASMQAKKGDIEAVLTPDQRQQLAQTRNQRRGAAGDGGF